MTEQQAPLKTYRGNCHCAAFVYEITLPEIKQASACNCSICYKKGVLWAFPKPTDVKFIKGDPTALTNYNFNNKQFTHKFCSTCGVSLMVVGHLTPPKAGEDKLPENGFNVRTIQPEQIDVWKLDTNTFNGAAIPSAYKPHKFEGHQPTADVEGGQLYTGSCHCGAVTVALKSKPIDKELQGLVECNCSICSRYGATWIYPIHAHVTIEGTENLATYYLGKKFAGKKFCKICGIPISSEAVLATDERVAQMDPDTRKWYEGAILIKALNLRVIDGLDVNDLTPARLDGYNLIKPGYVEP
ncbi:glutathione-dependent formaldehyde-activating enzyme [Hypoxylon argillaceum]|nr:glutathione-dependent formaldehyde-activating enzyme [Hypoxylon argillaceum]